MTKQVQRRRGTATQHTSFTGAEGEVSVNTTNKSVHVHDGVTAGGIEGARADLTNVSDSDLNARLTGNTLSSLTITSADINGGTIDGTVIGGTTPAAGNFTTGSFTGNATFGDNDKAIFGAGSDLQIYHTGAHSYIDDTGTGNLYLNSNGAGTIITGASETQAQFFTNGAVNLFYDNALKLATTPTGIDVTGTVTADGLTVDGTNATTVLIKDNDAFSGANNQIKLAIAPSVSSGNSAGIAFGMFSSDDYWKQGIFWQRTSTFGVGDIIIANRESADTTTVSDADQRLRIARNGDISFYEDTGTTPKFFWDASAESLNLGSTSSLYENTGGDFFLKNTNTGADLFLDSGRRVRFVTAGTERMRIDASGNVGIGVAPENSSGTWRNFEQGGMNMAARSSGAVDGMVGTNYVFKTDNSEVYKTTGAASRLFFNDSAMQFQIAASGTAGNAISWDEAMRIDSSGNVGIGTTSPARPLSVERDSSSSIVGTFKSANSQGAISLRGSATTSDTAVRFAAEGNDLLSFAGGSERMRIDASGNMLVGDTANPDVAALHVAGGGITHSSTQFNARAGTGNQYEIVNRNGAGFDFYVNNASNLAARIDASGNLLVGSPSGSQRLVVAGVTGQYASLINAANTSGSYFLTAFQAAGVNVGNITSNGTSTSYNTSSDYRLKEDVQPMTGASDRVQSLKPCNFAWKADGTRVDGFLAHEAQAVVPEAVTGEKDGEEMQAIDQSKLVPLLTAALQEALTKIDALETRITALEG